MKKILKCVPSRLLKSVTQDNNQWNQLLFTVDIKKIRLRNMLNICLVFWESEPQYAYKRYAYKKNMQPMVLRRTYLKSILQDRNSNIRGSSMLVEFRGNQLSRIDIFLESKMEFNFVIAKIREIHKIFSFHKSSVYLPDRQILLKVY